MSSRSAAAAPNAFIKYAQQKQTAATAAAAAPAPDVSYYADSMRQMEQHIAALQASESAAREHASVSQQAVAESAGFAALGQAVVSKLNEVADFGAKLDKAPPTITKTLRFAFSFNKRNKDGTIRKTEPDAAVFSKEALHRAFGVSVDKPVYVKEITLASTHSTAPYPLGFTLHGIEGLDAVPAVFSSSGAADVTAVVLPGTHAHNETVYSMGQVGAAAPLPRAGLPPRYPAFAIRLLPSLSHFPAAALFPCCASVLHRGHGGGTPP